jgi:hypothetical protein
MILSSAITKTISSTWVVGSGSAGLDVGAVTNSSWYYAYLIKRSDTGVVDALLSLSATNPTMPASYDKKRIVGAARTDSAGAFVSFTAYETHGGGLEYMWASPTLDVDLSNTLTTSRRTDVIKVPTSFSVLAICNIITKDSSAGHYEYICCPDQDDLAPSETAAPLAMITDVSATSTGRQLRIRTSSAGAIAARSTLATVDIYKVSTLGFEWGRR